MYDSNTQAISEKLAAASSTVFTQDTINSILSLISTGTDAKVVVDTVEPTGGVVTAAAGTDIVFVSTSDTQVTKVVANVDVPAIFFQGKGGVDASIGSPAPTADAGKAAATADPDAIVRVVVGTEGADTITITDGKNTQVIAGDKDTVKAGSGHTVVIAAEGKSTVVGGADTIVQTKGGDKDFTVTTKDGHVTIENTKTHVAVDMTGVHYVQLDDKEALIFAEDADQAALANLYHAVLGRTAEANGLEFWFEQLDKGVSLKAITEAFLKSDESKIAGLTNAEFVDTMYHDVMGRDGDAGGLVFWNAKLAEGVSRTDVIVAFAEAAATNAEEVTVVGSVTIVPHTV